MNEAALKRLTSKVRGEQELEAQQLPPACWNCGATMTPARTVQGEEVWVCHACEVNSEAVKPIPDLPRAWVAEEVRAEAGALRAVLICSAPLEDHLWLILDRSFVPSDGLACYYPEELPVLKTKTPQELREIHKVKLAFPGCRVIQEGADKDQ